MNPLEAAAAAVITGALAKEGIVVAESVVAQIVAAIVSLFDPTASAPAVMDAPELQPRVDELKSELVAEAQKS